MAWFHCSVAPGDVPLPQRLHGKGGGHGARSDGADSQLLCWLRSCVPHAPPHCVRCVRSARPSWHPPIEQYSHFFSRALCMVDLELVVEKRILLERIFYGVSFRDAFLLLGNDKSTWFHRSTLAGRNKQTYPIYHPSRRHLTGTLTCSRRNWTSTAPSASSSTRDGPGEGTASGSVCPSRRPGRVWMRC